MGNSTGDGAEEIRFTHDEPATFPQRTYSGSPVRIRLVRAMSAQHELFKSCSHQLDRLLEVLDRAVRPNSIPPAACRAAGVNVGGQS